MMRRKVVFQTAVLDDEYDVDAAETITTVLTTGAEVSQVSDAQRLNAGLSLTDDILNLAVPRGATTEAIDSNHRVDVDGDSYEIIRINRGNLRDRNYVFTVKRVV